MTATAAREGGGAKSGRSAGKRPQSAGATRPSSAKGGGKGKRAVGVGAPPGWSSIDHPPGGGATPASPRPLAGVDAPSSPQLPTDLAEDSEAMIERTGAVRLMVSQ